MHSPSLTRTAEHRLQLSIPPGSAGNALEMNVGRAIEVKVGGARVEPSPRVSWHNALQRTGPWLGGRHSVRAWPARMLYPPPLTSA
jgi:hypothetical protein